MKSKTFVPQKIIAAALAVVMLIGFLSLPVSAQMDALPPDMAAGQGRVIPFTSVLIECSETPGEEMEEGDYIRSRGQSDTSVHFSNEPLANATESNRLGWDYHLPTDTGTYTGVTVVSPLGRAGTFVIDFSGYWNGEGGGWSAVGFGTGELAGMQTYRYGADLEFDAAMSMVADDPRIVDGNPCYPAPLPEHGEAGLMYGVIVDHRSPDIVANAELAHSFLQELWQEGNFEAADQILADDELQTLATTLDDFRDQYPNAVISADDMAITPGKVAMRGSLLVEGKDVEHLWSAMLTIQDGKIADSWLILGQ